MSDLEVQRLVKRFGDNLVVDNISFSVREGEFFVLLGPSGGGKSTTLRMVCGLEQPDSGRIILNNTDITNMAPRQRNLGMVFQDYGLYPNMDVYGNIAYGLEARHVPRAEIDKRIKVAAEMLGLTPLLRRSCVDLSGGEQQRVALSRALVKDAEAYLFDEPLSNLDPKLRYQARKDIMAVHRTKQKPSIYVTHDQTEAFAMGNRIAVIAKGKLQQVGTSDELIQAPSNVFMARFVGTPPMNILNGTIRTTNTGYAIQAGGLAFALPQRWKRILEQYGQQNILLGIRPGALIPEWAVGHLDYQPQTSFRAEVVDVEPLVGETIVTLKAGSSENLTAVFEDSYDIEPEIGQTITISIDEEQLCLFDPRTEQALK